MKLNLCICLVNKHLEHPTAIFNPFITNKLTKPAMTAAQMKDFIIIFFASYMIVQYLILKKKY